MTVKKCRAKRDFVSPVFGNVFPGNALEIPHEQVKQFVDLGLVEIDDQPPADQPLEFDNNGLPWDYRIHSSNKKMTQDGFWQRRRNITDQEFEVIVSELKTGI